jgi:hypothetical protein
MRLLLKVLTYLPLPLLYACGRFVYAFTFHVVRWRRDQVERDLANALRRKRPANARQS